MKKNLLDPSSVQILIERVQNLTPDKQPLWGTMNATEMLVHCNTIHAYLLTPSAGESKPKTSLKQLLIRWVVLYVLPSYPKNAEAPKQLKTKGNASSAIFTNEKTTFIHLLNQFAAHKNPIAHNHPYFGRLSTHQWGLAMWKHTDHHLRQFAV